MTSPETEKEIINNEIQDEPESLNFGEYLAYLRKARGITKIEAVKMIGISAGYYGKLEKNKASPTLSVAYNLACFYGITVDDLAKRKAKEREDQIAQEIQKLEKTKETVKLLVPLDQISPRSRELYLKLLSSLTSE